MFVSNRARQLFADAQTLSPEQRKEFITNACADDNQLFDEVNSLLKASEDSVAFFSKLSDHISLSSLAEHDEPAHRGKMAGNWLLGDCIGRGGMGSVYLAERADDEFEKQAAVKLLPLGMDGDIARTRFAQERQILARLVHDNIARLLDGGVTDDGVPFFVMDFVDGKAIDEYCDENGLGTKARLRLMLDVCDAVQYAHRSLVVHRDLKPGNVLVEKGGRVRLLDFGVARVLEPSASPDQSTHYTQRPVTPVFASPEMLRGDPVDVTTDVYSIGVMLYLLLTNHVPISYEGLSAADSMQRADTAIPPRVDSIDTLLDADLAAIIAKALSKQPADRYSSVDRLALDLRDYLAGRPVSAKAPTRWYRVAKFAQRNGLPLAATSLAALALLATTILALLQSIEADRQRALAIVEQQRLHASNEFYSLLLEEMGDRPFTTVELLDRGRSLLEQQFGLERPFMGQILYDVSRNYARLEESEKQLELLRQAETLARETGDNNLLAMTSCRLAGVYARKDPDIARRYAVEGEAVYKNLADPRIEATLDCLRMIAKEAQREGELDDALAQLLKAKAALDRHPARAANLSGPLLNELSFVYFSKNDFENSLEQQDKILRLLEAGGRGNSLGYIRAASNKAVILQSAGKLDESLAAWQSLVQRLRASGYGNRGAASVLSRYGRALTSSGRTVEAELIHREGIEAAEAVGDEHNQAVNQLGLTRVHLANHDYAQAHTTLDTAQAFFLRNERVDPVMVGSSKILRIKAYRGEERLDRALETVSVELDAIGYPSVMRARMLDSFLIEATAIHQAMGSFSTAEDFASVVIGQMEKRAIGDPLESVDVARAYVHRAEIRLSLGSIELAIADLELSLPALVRVLGKDHREAIDAQDLLASATAE